MERDKTLVLLAAGGIALLVTLLTTVGVSSYWIIGLYCPAFLGFMIALVTSIVLFDLNAKHIEEAIRIPTARDRALRRLDSVSLCAFIVGSIFAIAVDIVSSTASPPYEREPMSEETAGSRVSGTRSVEGIGALPPKQSVPLSLGGTGAFHPKAPPRLPRTGESPAPAPATQQSSEGAGSAASG